VAQASGDERALASRYVDDWRRDRRVSQQQAR
jgi:hypothetical protein